MPEIHLNTYGIKDRIDGQSGYMLVTPTRLAYFEIDGSDVRVDRVRLFNDQGVMTDSFLRDKLGVLFRDNLSGTDDDLDYLQKL